MGAVRSSVELPISIVGLPEWLSAYQALTHEVSPAPGAPLALQGQGSVVGAVVPPGTDRQTLVTLAGLAVPVLELEPGKDAGVVVHGWIQRQLVDRLDRAEAAAAHERSASGRIRADLMKLQDNFSSFDAFFNQLGAPTFSCALDIPIGGQEVVAAEPMDAIDPADERTFKITQALPISAHGIAGLELHVTRLPQSPDAMLTVALGLDCSVDVPWSDLSIGWNRLLFPRCLGGERADALISITTTLRVRDSAAFGLGPPTPLARFHLATDGRCPPEATLAIRVWRGVPGATIPPLQRALPKPRGREADRLLLASDCPRPELLSAPDRREDFVNTDFWAREDAIFVHGTMLGPVRAIVRNVEVSGLTGVSAIVNAAHAKSPELGFRLDVAPSGGAETLSSDTAHSWTTLLPQQWGEAHAFLDRPHSGAVDLVLTVRTVNATTSNWAWGLFRGFRLLGGEG